MLAFNLFETICSRNGTFCHDMVWLWSSASWLKQLGKTWSQCFLLNFLWGFMTCCKQNYTIRSTVLKWCPLIADPGEFPEIRVGPLQYLLVNLMPTLAAGRGQHDCACRKDGLKGNKGSHSYEHVLYTNLLCIFNTTQCLFSVLWLTVLFCNPFAPPQAKKKAAWCSG